MRKPQLEKMSAKELADLRGRIDEMMEAKQADERRLVREQLEQFARKAGFSASELFSNGAARKGRKIAPKYRNPKNPAETWTGRGRKPRWMVAAGGNSKRFLIP